MTEEDFVRNLRGMNDGEDFPRPYLSSMYHAIRAQEIKWDSDKADASLTSPTPRREEAASREAEAKFVARKSYEVPVRKALAFCKNNVSSVHSFLPILDPHIVKGMYDACWFPCQKAFSARVELAGGDVELLHICLDGIAYGAAVGVVLGPSVADQRLAFAAQLAKVQFMERNKHSPNLAQRIADEEHLRDKSERGWYRHFNSSANKDPVATCRTIFTNLEEVKASIHLDRAQATLKRIEADFGGEIVLSDPHRALVREGRLIKVNNAGTKRTPYHFMLFNDLILYASEGSMGIRYKVHRVVHLSLCRLEDVRSSSFPHAFRIISPQKSFLVLAESAEKKKRWLDAILHNLTQVMAERKKYMEEQNRKQDELEQKQRPAPLPSHFPAKPNGALPSPLASPSAGPSAPSSAASSPTSPTRREMLRISSSMDFDQGKESTLRRYSTFIGQSDLDLNSRKNAIDSAAAGLAGRSLAHCKLCLRPFNSIFKRKQRCRICQDIVCQDCCKNKVKEGGKAGKLVQVCDACYGATIGMVGDDVKMLTIKEEQGGAPPVPTPGERGGSSERRKTT